MDNEVNNKTLDIIEARIKKVEDKIIGKDLDSISNQKEDIISTLAFLGSKLGNALSTRDRMMMVMKRLDELERYLDPSYGEASEMSDDVKLDLILVQEEKIYNQLQLLNKLNSMKKCLDSQDIADTLSSLDSDVIQIWRKYDETAKLVGDQSEEIAQMLEKYNSIIMTLTETFVRMDDIVTKAEAAAAKEKVLD